MAERRHLTGQVLVACNCRWGCPCDCDAPPSTANVKAAGRGTSEEGLWRCRPRRSELPVYANWPGAIHEGNGEAFI